jgi:uncharacterized protein with GYD domain
MEAVKALVASVDGELEAIYWSLGKYDYYIVATMPDSKAAAALAIAVQASGAVNNTTSELFDAAELDDIVGRRVAYRAPGS